MPDPKTSGTGYGFYLNVVNIMGEDKAIEYFKKLKGNLREYTTSGSGPTNLLKQGEIAIAMGMTAQGVEAINAGYNFSIVELETGSPYNTTSCGIIKGRETNKNVEKVFNWLIKDFGKYDKENYMPDKILKELTLKIWRQKDAKSKGEFKTYKVHNISTGTSFLEMLDILNEQLVEQNEEPVAFDHDCREGICGTCSLFVDGRAHGPDDDVTTCQLHMRRFEDGATITIEPWRCGAFPVIKDLIVDRKAYDKILQAGGYVSVSTGGVPDANAIPIANDKAEEAMDAAACIGCGACAATCKNSSAMLFVAAKVSQLALLPQGKIEAARRAKAMVAKMDELGFGNCTNTGACEMECPKSISIAHIARLNREFLKAKLKD